MKKKMVFSALVSITCIFGISNKSFADNDTVFLHCNGVLSIRDAKNTTKILENKPTSFTITIDKKGTWIKWLGKKRSRTGTSNSGDTWNYRYRSIFTDKMEQINFDRKKLSISYGSDANTHYSYTVASCFPITNPFLD